MERLTIFYFTGILDGTYLSVVLIGILTMFVILPHAKPNYNKYLVKMYGWTLVLDFLSSLYSIIQYFCWPEYTCLQSLSHFIDCLTLGMLLMTGITLLEENRFPSFRQWGIVFGSLVIGFGTHLLLTYLGYPHVAHTFIVTMVFAEVIILIYLLRSRDSHLKELVSNLDPHTTHLFSIILSIIVLNVALWYVAYAVLPYFSIFNLFYIINSTVLWLAMTHFICTQKVSQEEEQEEEILNEEDSQNAFTRIGRELKKFEDEGTFFLNPDINRAVLARMICTNRTYITRYFSQERNTTFYDYINDLRIGYAEDLLLSSDEKIEAIAQQSGFTNARTFTRVFTKKHNIAPGKWRMRHKKF